LTNYRSSLIVYHCGLSALGIMMTWTNYHTHCYLCDGAGEPEAYVQVAVEQGMKALGFSSHASVPFENSWTLSEQNWVTYQQCITQLQRTYADQLPIFFGLEIDYIPGVISPRDAHFAHLDYCIGAIHFVDQDAQGRPWTIDGPLESFEQGMQQVYQGDVRPVVERFYALVREMVQIACPDVIAHFDLIKKNNTGGRYFAETEPWYQAAAFETLETIAQADTILEVNTGGITRKRTDALYPSTWLLERCFELGIPLTLSADAHEPQHVSAGFAEAAQVLQAVGYRELYYLGASGWRACDFTPAGLAL
jgi:histidinol-phosphatase (PHP family)